MLSLTVQANLSQRSLQSKKVFTCLTLTVSILDPFLLYARLGVTYVTYLNHNQHTTQTLFIR
ncbi:hypothetical protein HanIR_Chr10g0482671 [Helianthus annuus]|nr:hypothetical protein HanIR_Chr10g0482671 [Helianthus annuus]